MAIHACQYDPRNDCAACREEEDRAWNERHGHALAGCDGEDDVHDPSDDLADAYDAERAL